MESSISHLVLSGLNLMLIGMTIVFLFLALLVWIIGFTARLVNRFSPEFSVTVPEPGTVYPVSHEPESESELIAVISAAILRHQNN